MKIEKRIADNGKGAGFGPFNWTDVEEAITEVPQFFNLKNPLPRGMRLLFLHHEVHLG
jgi:hypothetical protein